MTSEKSTAVSVESRLLEALHGARIRRQRVRRRGEQRKARWLSSFSKFGLERHHLSESQSEG
jgi:hypothetical protein